MENKGTLTKLRRAVFGLNTEEKIEQAINGKTLQELLVIKHSREAKKPSRWDKFCQYETHPSHNEDMKECMIGHPESRLRWPSNKHAEITRAIYHYVGRGGNERNLVEGYVKNMIIGRTENGKNQKTRIVPIGIMGGGWDTFVERPYVAMPEDEGGSEEEQVWYIKKNHKDIIWNTCNPQSEAKLIRAMERVCRNQGLFPRYGSADTHFACYTYEYILQRNQYLLQASRSALQDQNRDQRASAQSIEITPGTAVVSSNTSQATSQQLPLGKREMPSGKSNSVPEPQNKGFSR